MCASTEVMSAETETSERRWKTSEAVKRSASTAISSTFFVTARSWLFMMATSFRWVVISRRTPAKPTPVVRTMSTTCAAVAGPADQVPPAAAAVDDVPPARIGGVAQLAAADLPRGRVDAAPFPGEGPIVPAATPARPCCKTPPPALERPASATEEPASAPTPPPPGAPPRRVSDGLGGERRVAAAPRRLLLMGDAEVAAAVGVGSVAPCPSKARSWSTPSWRSRWSSSSSSRGP